MDSAEFHALAYNIIRQIPVGRVTSYGHIARLMGMPRHSRHVGQALKFLPAGSNVPWQRVVSSSGAISSRGPGTDGAQRQREALEAEGVDVAVGRTGELLVSLAQYGWFPASVDGAAVGDGDEDEGEDADGQ